MKKKILISLIAIFVISAFCIWYYVFQYSKTHHRKVETENAIKVTPDQIVKAYQNNEQAANKSYLNKTIQLTGLIAKRDKDQAGHITLTIKSSDPFTNVFCTLKSSVSISTRDSLITIKGICSGFLSDVVLNDAIIVNQNKEN